jgi:hypothetical protein
MSSRVRRIAYSNSNSEIAASSPDKLGTPRNDKKRSGVLRMATVIVRLPRRPPTSSGLLAMTKNGQACGVLRLA